MPQAAPAGNTRSARSCPGIQHLERSCFAKGAGQESSLSLIWIQFSTLQRCLGGECVEIIDVEGGKAVLHPDVARPPKGIKGRYL